jgi:hypothetical protein
MSDPNNDLARVCAHEAVLAFILEWLAFDDPAGAQAQIVAALPQLSEAQNTLMRVTVARLFSGELVFDEKHWTAERIKAVGEK